MGKKTRRRFSSEEKAKAVRSHLIDKRKVSDIADELGIHPNLFYKWQSELFENASFSQKTDTKEKALLRKFATLEEKLTNLNNS